MSRISKTTIVLVTMTLLAILGGCKKSPPEPESRQPVVVKSEPAAAQKIVRAEKIQPIKLAPPEVIPASEASDFQFGEKLQAAGEVIDVKVGHLVPHVVDWNNDGKKDMLTGQFSSGRITLYLNIGTDEAPEFGEGTFLHADNKPIRLDAG